MIGSQSGGDTRKRTNDLDRFIGKRVREERVRRGLSQQNLADVLGITYQQEHKYERGINRISAARLFQIAKALGAQVTEFFPPVDGEEPLSNGSRQDLELAKNFGRLANQEHRNAVSYLVRALLTDEAA